MGDYTGPEDEAFFAAVGRLAISWAHIEGGLDGLISILFRELGNSPGDAEIPLSLSRKLRYLRRAFRELPVPENDRPKYEKLFSDIAAESETRHDIIHGIIIEQAEGSGEAVAVRLLNRGTYHEPKRTELTTNFILQAAVRANKLARVPLALSSLLYQELRKRDER